MRFDIIIDISIFSRALCAMKGMGVDYLTRKQDREEIIHTIMQDVNSIISRYDYNMCHYCFDNFTGVKSFRHDIGIHPYKQHRKHGIVYNQYAYMLMMRELHDELKYQHQSTKAYEIPGLEADDLIYIVSNMLYLKDISSMIISSDSDLTQILKSESSKYITMYKFARKSVSYHIIPKEMVKSGDDDFFDIYGDLNKNRIMEHNEVVNRNEMLFVKILGGDKSDNIPGVHSYAKGKQTVGYTKLRSQQLYDSKYSQILDGKNIEQLLFDHEFLKQLSQDILLQIKDTLSEQTIQDIISNIQTNINYILLSQSTIPKDLFKDAATMFIKQNDDLNYAKVSGN